MEEAVYVKLPEGDGGALEAKGNHEEEAHVNGCARLLVACKSCLRSVYFWANLLYLGYTLQALAVDWCSVIHPDLPFLPPPPFVASPPPLPSTSDYSASDYASSSDYNASSSDYASSDYASSDYGQYRAPLCVERGYSPINKQYEALAAVHVVSAVVYGAAWIPWYRANPERSAAFKVAVMVPEVLNLVEAALYMHSSRFYAPNSLDASCRADYACKPYMRLHYVELSACIIELFASVGYCWVWWSIHERRPGRGLTLWDLDAWCQFFLVISSLVYFVYYLDVTRHPEHYGTNFEYKTADTMYFVGALLYLFSDMRDNDFFFWIPTPCIPEPPAEAYEQLPAAGFQVGRDAMPGDVVAIGPLPPIAIAGAAPAFLAEAAPAEEAQPRTPSTPGTPSTRRAELLAEAASPVPDEEAE